ADAGATSSAPFVLGVVLGKGDGTFAPATRYVLEAGESGSIVGAADVNRDGFEDFMLLGARPGARPAEESSEASVFFGGPDGIPVQGPSSTLAVDWFEPTAWGDFDGNGIPELVGINPQGLVRIAVAEDGSSSVAAEISIGGDHPFPHSV